MRWQRAYISVMLKTLRFALALALLLSLSQGAAALTPEERIIASIVTWQSSLNLCLYFTQHPEATSKSAARVACQTLDDVTAGLKQRGWCFTKDRPPSIYVAWWHRCTAEDQ
jgi:hypothetical protein